MTSLVVFRPGLAEGRSAFEAEALVYQYLQSEYGYDVTLVIAENDSFSDDTLDIQRIPDDAWRSWLSAYPMYPRRFLYRRVIDPILRDADLILTDDPTIKQPALFVGRRARRHGTPVVYETSLTIPGVGLNLAWELFGKRHAIRLLSGAKAVVVTVPKGLERFRSIGLYTEDIADKFEVIGHPVNTAMFRPQPPDDTEDTLRITVVSRLVPEKGWSYIIPALAPILRERPDVELEILGEGPMREGIERDIERREIEHAVTFLRTVPHEEVPAVLNRGDVFVNHAVSIGNWEEFFGVVNLEAMACGLPCVLSQCGAVPQVVDESAVELVPERSVSDLRRSIRTLLDEPTQRDTLGRRAREHVNDAYSVEVIADRYDELLRSGRPHV